MTTTPLAGLDEVGVDEDAGLPGLVGVDAGAERTAAAGDGVATASAAVPRAARGSPAKAGMPIPTVFSSVRRSMTRPPWQQRRMPANADRSGAARKANRSAPIGERRGECQSGVARRDGGHNGETESSIPPASTPEGPVWSSG